MQFNPRLVSFVLAFSVAFITTAFISLINSNLTLLFITFTIAFSSCFLLTYFTFEFLVLAEINEVYAILEKMKKKDFKIAKERDMPSLSPIKKLNYEIYSYGEKKQKEIDHLKKLAIYRREFLADVSHELKTPIFAAQGFVHTLIDGAIDDEEVRYKFLNKAAKSLDGLNTLVDDLFTLSKMEAGIIKMNPVNFNIYTLVKETFEQLEDKAKKKNITLLFKENLSQSWLIFADVQRISQVMTNLIQNAIKYGNENGQVIVGFENADKNIEITVEDNGPGIPVEHLDRIFERFYRVEKSRSKEKGGSGLGLAIVKHIIDAHESTIQVSSKLKKGTIFTFRLKKAEIEPKNDAMSKLTPIESKKMIEL